ncbi:MAG TPA: hypothetical protein VGB68_17065, partial [Pyrinomonadaceae bacterium]
LQPFISRHRRVQLVQSFFQSHKFFRLSPFISRLLKRKNAGKRLRVSINKRLLGNNPFLFRIENKQI